jgi:uncharacterized protein YecA (UPF0149 family)
MLKKVILGYVACEYYTEEQVAELCETEPLVVKYYREQTFTKVGRNDPCPCCASALMVDRKNISIAMGDN